MVHKSIEGIQDALDAALQSDLEHGVKYLNEEAWRKFAADYPELYKVLVDISNLEV